MNLVCLDLEGVLVPEIWINVALETGIEELKLTTRDIADYDVLMRRRLEILAENDLKLPDIQTVIAGMDPLDEAGSFLDVLRSRTQVILLSDTFTQFARPLMEKLGFPTLFCNTLVVSPDGRITDYILRQQDGKRKAVEAMKSIGFHVVAAGDSYNDATMLQAADAGIFFRAPDTIKAEFPGFPCVETHTDLLGEIEKLI
ncbi:MAG: bifunctional phosphoserine phosphatase/homoserine phosphotransferase ThrH [Spirochaetota bacterium]